jgi:hypothetical protein
MMFDILEGSKVKKKVIGVSLYGDNGFWYGIIVDYNEDIVQLQNYTEYGQLNGVSLLEFSQIERVDFNDEHTNSLEFLIKNQDEFKKMNYKNLFFNELTDDDWKFQALKPYEKERKLLVGVQINQDDTYFGFIEKIDEEYFSFRCIGNLGEDKGLCVFNTEDVTSFVINDLDCRKRYLLFNIIKK